MNQLIIDVFNIYTYQELLRLAILYLALIMIVSGLAYHLMRDYKYVLHAVLSLFVALLIYTGMAYLAKEVLETVTNGYQQIGIITMSIIVSLSLIAYQFRAFAESHMKRPDPDHVNRWHFATTLNYVVMLLLLGLSFGFFTPIYLGEVFFVTAISAAFGLIIVHAIAVITFRDKTIR